MRNILVVILLGLLFTSCQKEVSQNYMHGTWKTTESENNRFFAEQMQLESNLVSLEFSDVKNPKGFNYMHVRIDDKIMSCYYNVESNDRISLGPNADGNDAMHASIERIDKNNFKMTISEIGYSAKYKRK